MNSRYETVIGLEVHVQLNTRTKIFCGCSTVFGAEPNTQVCPVCLGLPGALPVFNKKAFEFAIKVAIALGCEIQKVVKFDRKNYYYPDLPKNFQISQYDMPIAFNGSINIKTSADKIKKIGVTRAHLEEDAGKLIHDENKPFSYVDLNRTGTPLLEIVSEPEMFSSDEAYEYLTKLKQIIKYLDVSDCNMEEGSLRCDANISLRKKGEDKLGTKVEIKNLNSFKAVRDSLLFEVERQRDKLDSEESIIQETRLWNENKNVTESMRVKEDAHDYRYFPEPDLVPFEIDAKIVEQMRQNMSELPSEKKERFLARYELEEKDVDFLILEKEIADYFEEVISEYNNSKSVCNWIRGEILMHLKEKSVGIKELNVLPGVLAGIIKMTDDGILSRLSAKEVLAVHIDTGRSPDEIVEKKGLKQVSDTGELEKIVLAAIAENSKSVSDYKDGKTNALSFLVGQVMKKSKGKANPKVAGDLLKNKMGDN
ncbi:MAG: Asp-tRNA(Asn)/Glu-tRNA(Gln) amidotransferase subunit GatB [Candidatus Omnitrophica bacterium]|nr:Asp-tRNA(Asn)/Glu-tRNA(Gln) amidotransferase subunit GatB [Candidatus Omnitrophota bacterium]